MLPTVTYTNVYMNAKPREVKLSSNKDVFSRITLTSHWNTVSFPDGLLLYISHYIGNLLLIPDHFQLSKWLVFQNRVL